MLLYSRLRSLVWLSDRRFSTSLPLGLPLPLHLIRFALRRLVTRLRFSPLHFSFVPRPWCFHFFLPSPSPSHPVPFLSLDIFVPPLVIVIVVALYFSVGLHRSSRCVVSSAAASCSTACPTPSVSISSALFRAPDPPFCSKRSFAQ